MICCKIISDFNNKNGNFTGVLETLGKTAELYWNGNYLFLGETESNLLSEKKIIKILKSKGYTKVFVDIYSKDNQPSEDDFINGWLMDKIIKINYALYEKENQKMLQDTMEGLEMLDAAVEAELKKQQEKGGGDSGTRRN